LGIRSWIMESSLIPFFRWQIESGFYRDFMIGIFAAVAFSIAQSARGLKIWKYPTHLWVWLIICILVLLSYLLLATLLYRVTHSQRNPTCLGVTKNGKSCGRRISPEASYCWQHPDGKRRKQDVHLPRVNWGRIVSGLGILLAVIGLLFSLYQIKQAVELSEQSLSETFWLTSPVILEVTQHYNDTVVLVNVTNTHPKKRTGALYLYKLELNPNKPEQIDLEGIGPGETMKYTLRFEHETVPVTTEMENRGWYSTMSIPGAGKAYYVVAHHASISYRVNCDACPSHGFIRRIPASQSVPFILTTGEEDNLLRITGAKISVYNWMDFRLKDIASNASNVTSYQEGSAQ